MKLGFIRLLPLLLLQGNACQTELSKTTSEEFKQSIEGTAQGTTYRIVYYDLRERDLKPQVDSILDRIDQSVSTYYPNSVIDRWNKSDSGTVIDTLFLELLLKSNSLYHTSLGAFNPAVKPLVSYWGFGPDKFEHPGHIDTQVIDSMLQLLNLDTLFLRLNGQRVELDEVEPLKNFQGTWELIKPIPAMQLDFNAIGQGWSVDRIAHYLNLMEMKIYFIELGGEIVAGNPKPDGTLWRFGIDKPVDPETERSIQAVINLRNRGLATSGNYRKFYERDGVRYAHTIDPLTGFPVRHGLLSATVVGSDATTADAMATAFMVMGMDSTIKFLEERNYLGTYVYLISTDSLNYRTFTSTQIQDILEE